MNKQEAMQELANRVRDIGRMYGCRTECYDYFAEDATVNMTFPTALQAASFGEEKSGVSLLDPIHRLGMPVTLIVSPYEYIRSMWEGTDLPEDIADLLKAAGAKWDS